MVEAKWGPVCGLAGGSFLSTSSLFRLPQPRSRAPSRKERCQHHHTVGSAPWFMARSPLMPSQWKNLRGGEQLGTAQATGTWNVVWLQLAA